MNTIYQKRANNAFYATSYVHCPTGVYILAGTMPEYMQQLYFLDEQTAKCAVEEAVQCLNRQAGRSDKRMDTMLYSQFGRFWLSGLCFVATRNGNLVGFATRGEAK